MASRDSSGDKMSKRHGEKRREIPHGDRERDERRAPHDVHGHEREPDLTP